MSAQEEKKSVRAFAAMQVGHIVSPYTFQARALKPHEVAVDVTHCGQCHSDLHKIGDEWVGAGASHSKYPMVPGHEVVGHVVAMGSEVDRNLFHIGDRVGMGPQRGSCKSCNPCNEGDEQLCTKFEDLYDPETGGYAEHIICDSRFVFHIPESISSAEAAPLLCAGVTTYAPLAYYNPPKGGKVGVVGVGGLGHMGLQYAAAMGYRTVAISRQADKVDDAKKFGAQDFLLSSDPEQMKKHFNSFDFIMVSASSNLDWAAYLDLLSANGKLCLLGIPSEPLQIPAFSIIGRRRTVCGSGIGGTKLMKEMLEFSAKHKCFPLVEVLKVKMNESDKVNEAIQRILRGEPRYRVVLEFDKQ